MVSSMKHLGNSTVGNLPLASMPPKTARVARTKRDGTDKEVLFVLNHPSYNYSLYYNLE
jgi:hypothetical protein